jgi:hypothetical protein
VAEKRPPRTSPVRPITGREVLRQAVSSWNAVMRLILPLSWIEGDIGDAGPFAAEGRANNDVPRGSGRSADDHT